MMKTMFMVIGISLLVVGGGLCLVSTPMSKEEVGRRVTRINSDGEKYRVSGDFQKLLEQENTPEKANTRRVGGVLAISGIILAVTGIATGAASRKQESAEPDD